MAVIVATDPGATDGLAQAMGAAFGQVQVPPPVVVAETETKVVLAGVVSLRVAVVQSLGPPLDTVCV